uniref:Extracellular calcium-sensing receptor-like n=1 Tax=Oryzias melastigma TaxID=30732 RepID=A0A3B3BQG7_ORYME
MPSLFKPGDIMIGGIFPIFNKEISNTIVFEREPGGTVCSFDLRAFRWTQVMIFAIEEINKDPAFLPNVSLGYRILDSCASPTNALRAASTLAAGPQGIESPCPPAISALIAESGSSQSVAVAGVLGPFQLPIISYFSTCACLSNRDKFPTFFRTIPSDYFQAKALAALVKHFGWKWIGAIQSDNDYGRNGIQAFIEEVKKMGVCVAFVGTVLRTYSMSKILDVVEMIKQSSVKVILAFVPEGDFYPLMKELSRQNITGIQWIASEAWITAARPSTPEMFPAFGGTLGFVVQKMAIPDLQSFLRNINPYADPNAAFVRDFWEVMFGCRPVSTGIYTGTNKICEGNETLMNSQDVFFNVTQLRVSYNVYKAVYAIAHALHELVFCQSVDRKPARPCMNVSEIQPQEVTDHIKHVNFRNRFGDSVFFDQDGDPPASYDIINWQLDNGKVQHVTVGQFISTQSGTYKLQIDEKKIVWMTGQMVPKSVCSDVCPMGTRRASIRGKATCCFDCIPCADGTISNSTSVECLTCPEDFWSSRQNDHCVPKKIEFLSYHEPLGICLTAASLLGTFICSIVFAIFTYHRSTPVVRANNSELSFLILVSLKLCFLCSLLFIGQPQLWTCQLRHAVFGISFVLCVSCILVKTMVVLAVFKSSKPGGGANLKWFGSVQQRGTVLGLTCVQAIVCTVWIISASPTPYANTRYHNDKIIYECVVGSTTGFAVLLGYISLLAIISFLLAFLARNLPDNFNEAKFITFSMLIFCAVWVAFVPAYVNSPGKYADAVEVFAILASSFGLLVALFGPKCYIILLKPEKNTRKAIM